MVLVFVSDSSSVLLFICSNLSYNVLTSIAPGAFSSLVSLSTLYIQTSIHLRPSCVFVCFFLFFFFLE
eukprot:m.623187 g.623187  ORF g.623187 m.623187 type:complete len:68 (-) comp58222_c0_seq55:5-208(-)